MPHMCRGPSHGLNIDQHIYLYVGLSRSPICRQSLILRMRTSSSRALTHASCFASANPDVFHWASRQVRSMLRKGHCCHTRDNPNPNGSLGFLILGGMTPHNLSRICCKTYKTEVALRYPAVRTDLNLERGGGYSFPAVLVKTHTVMRSVSSAENTGDATSLNSKATTWCTAKLKQREWRHVPHGV